jgi:hypothetical protein
VVNAGQGLRETAGPDDDWTILLIRTYISRLPGRLRPATRLLSRARWIRLTTLLRPPGWSWTVGQDWLIPFVVAVATLFLGAALGGLPALVAGTWTDPQTRIGTWAVLALGAFGLLALLASWLIWHGRREILRRNGTAFIIQETASGWSADDSRMFLAAVKRQFARKIDVPGPGRLSGPWDWALSDAAQDWEGRLTELIRAFQALRSDDDSATPTGIFIWAWAPVAMAFGTRVTAADRGLVLDVWQRPSRGRAGDFEVTSWSQRPHRFGAGQTAGALRDVLPGSAQEYRWRAQVTIRPPESAVDGGSQRVTKAAGSPVILLIRLGAQPWGPLPEVPAIPDPDTRLTLALRDAAGLGLPNACQTDVQEFRVEPPASAGVFPWAAYPALVVEAAAWIRQRAAEAAGRTVLIGTIVPPEVALGLGVSAGQVSAAAWPAYLWPMVFECGSGEFVLPYLNLGTALCPPSIQMRG